jgi:hypothetical protein
MQKSKMKGKKTFFGGECTLHLRKGKRKKEQFVAQVQQESSSTMGLHL